MEQILKQLLHFLFQSQQKVGLGYGEKSRVLKWICERAEGVGQSRGTSQFLGMVCQNPAAFSGFNLPFQC
jgi:GTP-dependent phosphoenolpyruvate carboxykinase